MLILAYLSGWAAPAALLQLNVGGLTTAKLNIVEQIAIQNKVVVILLHENKNILRLPGYSLASYIAHTHHSIATFILNDIWSSVAQSDDGTEIEWLKTEVHNTNIIKVF